MSQDAKLEYLHLQAYFADSLHIELALEVACGLPLLLMSAANAC